MKTNRSFAVQTTRAEGFTLTDLLAILIIIGVLGALLLPALASTKPNSQAFQCMENQRQLARAWQMYAQDNQGNLARNGDEGSQPISPTDPALQGTLVQWCPGRMDPEAPATGEQTDPAWIKAGCIYPYANTVTVYRCPADTSTALAFGQIKPRTRSVAMNGWIGPIQIWSASANGRPFYEESDLGVMGPANIWLLIDENPYGIDDAYMAEYGPTVPPAAPNLNWVEYPASYHNGGAGISFCDGHAQIRKWKDATVLNQRTPYPPPMPPNPLTCPDLPWLQAHATSAQ